MNCRLICLCIILWKIFEATGHTFTDMYFFNFNGFFLLKSGVRMANFGSLEKFQASRVLLNSAFNVSEQLFLLIF